ncbi:MAG: polysaccharide biosynthesis protein [Christensenellaceae bacterium]|nr:polysaccharide biosynthesis protein [Christensenellaceae bacterium]
MLRNDKINKKCEKNTSSSFLKGAGLLSLAILIAKIVGAFYRIPLTNILGAEGIGVYQLIFPVYSFLLSTSSGALPIAISMLTSQYLAKGERERAENILNISMSALLFVGMIVAMSLIALSGVISRLQGNELASLGYIAIAPSVFFVSGIAVLRGWFQGNGKMQPSALSQLIESIVKLLAGLTIAKALLPYGIKWAVFGALTGVTISECITFFSMYLIYRKSSPPFKLNLNLKTAKSNYKEIMNISTPMTIGGMILPISQIIDSLLVVNILSYALGSSVATASYGLYMGCVNALINFPVMLAISLGVAVIPQISKDKESRDVISIMNKINTAVKLALVINMPVAFMFISIPKILIQLLYPSITPAEIELAASLLRIGAVGVVALSVTQICTSILQGLGAVYKPIKNMLAGIIVKIVSMLILLPLVGIYGIAIASLLCFLLTAALNIATLIRLIGISGGLFKSIRDILLASSIICLAITLLVSRYSNWLCLLLSVLAGTIIYIFLLIAFRTFLENELLAFPFGKQLIRIFHINNK